MFGRDLPSLADFNRLIDARDERPGYIFDPVEIDVYFMIKSINSISRFKSVDKETTKFNI